MGEECCFEVSMLCVGCSSGEIVVCVLGVAVGEIVGCSSGEIVVFVSVAGLLGVARLLCHTSNT